MHQCYQVTPRLGVALHSHTLRLPRQSHVLANPAARTCVCTTGGDAMHMQSTRIKVKIRIQPAGTAQDLPPAAPCQIAPACPKCQLLTIKHLTRHVCRCPVSMTHHRDEGPAEREPDGRRVALLLLGIPRMQRERRQKVLGRFFVHTNVQTWRKLQLYWCPGSSHATPRLKVARVNIGFSSNARLYASTASSGLPPFARVAPSRFQSK